MAKKAYGGVSNTSRNGIKLYGGVVNTSRKIIKGYVGVSNLSRQFWPPGITEKYVIFKDGVFTHVPTGFDFSGNVAEYIDPNNFPTSREEYISNKVFWIHIRLYTREWSVQGISINSNFVYNYDMPSGVKAIWGFTNEIYIPSWKQTYATENRAIIPSGANNYYLRITGYGYFRIMLHEIKGPTEPGALNTRNIEFNPVGEITEGVYVRDYIVTFDTDDVVTVNIPIKSSSTTRYMDRVEINAIKRNSTYDNEWLESKEVKKWNSTAQTWSEPVKFFGFEFGGFLIYYYGGYPERVVAEVTMSNAQVYSISWRHANDFSVPMHNGAELLSKAPFTVHCVAYDYHDTIMTDETVSAEQIIYNGIPFYRYRYDIGKRYYYIDDWVPNPIGDNITGTLFSEDGRLEYEFFESLREDLSPIQIQEISIITL